jgi:hypothetical protein
MRFVPVALLLGSLLALAGCGSKSQTVTGSVTFDGEPVKEGRIAFIPDRGGQGGGGAITNGYYTLDVPPGKYRVEINASKMTKLPGGQVGMYGEKEELREYIPEKYNAKTELKADVPPPASLDFNLKSK